ncbi:PaaI family thioesterase [Comamonas sp. GB3 AK4-5]|uniref:PaaI family thioesterase n=1 Tax=Comamonas sp. GB3 AK4-5 TaxID=3231487 RepID=UPI00351DD9C0
MPIEQTSSLAEWLEQEQTTNARRTLGPGPGVASQTQTSGKSGLEVLQAMLDGEIPCAPMAKTLNYTLISVEPGKAIFQGTPSLNLLNSIGTVHGGWYATLLDSAMGCAVYTLIPTGYGYTTAELSVNLVRSVSLNVLRVRAEGTVIHCGRKLATAEARLIGPDGMLYAHATTTCLVLRAVDATEAVSERS